MKITILGCGPSYGIPSLTRGFGTCDAKNPKNVRTRTSALIQGAGVNVLIDTSPDVKEQLLKQKSPKINALVYTHVHYDHCGGAEDLKKMIQDRHEVIDVYAHKKDIVLLMDKFDYVFKKGNCFKMHAVPMYRPFQIGDLTFTPILQKHGEIHSVGHRINDVAYTTDVKSFSPKGWKVLSGIKTWILACATTKENNKHVHLAEVLKWVDKINPKKCYLTHMGLHMDYDELVRSLPKKIIPCYDNMKIIDKK